MKVTQALFGLLVLAVALASAKVSYDKHEVWRIKAESDFHKHFLRRLITEYNLDVWSDSRSHVDVRISPERLETLSTILTRKQFEFQKMIPNLGEIIKAEEERIAAKPAVFSLTEYNSFEDIEAYLTGIAVNVAFATLQSIGTSVEGRNLWQLVLSVPGGRGEALWIDCNIHAREWITAATCLYGIDYLTTQYGTDGDVTTLLNNYDVYIMPVNNPDGYAYTWSDDRMWRKNRNRYAGDTCYGIDINRNFDDHFAGEGTSNVACSETFHGPSPASEPETNATQNAIVNLVNTKNLRILYSIHSYSQLWMFPYGWTSAVTVDNTELNNIAATGVAALTAVHGTQYVYGPVSTTIYPAASTTIDYSYAKGVKYSYTLELRDTGTFGFILPAAQNHSSRRRNLGWTHRLY